MIQILGKIRLFHKRYGEGLGCFRWTEYGQKLLVYYQQNSVLSLQRSRFGFRSDIWKHIRVMFRLKLTHCNYRKKIISVFIQQC